MYLHFVSNSGAEEHMYSLERERESTIQHMTHWHQQSAIPRFHLEKSFQMLGKPSLNQGDGVDGGEIHLT